LTHTQAKGQDQGSLGSKVRVHRTSTEGGNCITSHITWSVKTTSHIIHQLLRYWQVIKTRLTWRRSSVEHTRGHHWIGTCDVAFACFLPFPLLDPVWPSSAGFPSINAKTYISSGDSSCISLAQIHSAFNCPDYWTAEIMYTYAAIFSK